MKLTNLTILTLALAFAVGANVVSAQGPNGRGQVAPQAQEKMEELRANYEARQQEMRELREKARADMDERRDAVKQNLLGRMASSTARKEFIAEKRAELRQSHMARLVENATKMLSVTSDRFEKIIDRIESRIEKIKDAGGDTAEAESFVAKAKTDLGEVRAAIANLSQVEVSSSTATTTPRNFESLRTAVRAVKEEIKSVHENLKSAVQSLIEVEKPESDNSDDSDADNQ